MREQQNGNLFANGSLAEPRPLLVEDSNEIFLLPPFSKDVGA